jgi:hypothetical protein
MAGRPPLATRAAFASAALLMPVLGWISLVCVMRGIAGGLAGFAGSLPLGAGDGLAPAPAAPAALGAAGTDMGMDIGTCMPMPIPMPGSIPGSPRASMPAPPAGQPSGMPVAGSNPNAPGMLPMVAARAANCSGVAAAPACIAASMAASNALIAPG